MGVRRPINVKLWKKKLEQKTVVANLNVFYCNLHAKTPKTVLGPTGNLQIKTRKRHFQTPLSMLPIS